MNFDTEFVPTSAQIGVLPMVTYYMMTVAAYAFLGNFIFSLATQKSVAPEHRISRVYGAIIAAVAGVSYLLITRFYHGMLHDLSQLNSPEAQENLIRRSYQAIGQYRYMDWTVTTPLLLLKCTSMLRIRFREATGAISLLLLADFFMVLTGYIGEQQLLPSGEINVHGKLLWGAVSTVGYVIVVVVLYRLYQRFAERGKPRERWGYKFVGITTVTSWGVYPLGYMLTLTSLNLNYVHLVFSVADIFNKVGVSVVAYLVAKQLLDERVDEQATETAYVVA